jgi:hypothetical protein
MNPNIPIAVLTMVAITNIIVIIVIIVIVGKAIFITRILIIVAIITIIIIMTTSTIGTIKVPILFHDLSMGYIITLAQGLMPQCTPHKNMIKIQSRQHNLRLMQQQ